MRRSWALLSATAVCTFAFVGCEPATEKKAEKAANEAAAAAKDAADAAKDAAKDATAAAKDAAKEATNAAKDAAGAAADLAKSAVAASGLDDVYKKASESLSSIEGGESLLTGFKDSFSKLSETLGSVKDSDTAAAAAPVINQLTEAFNGYKDQFEKLPEAAKKTVASVFESLSKEIKPAVDKVMALPGVETVLKPAVESLLAKLQEFKAS